MYEKHGLRKHPLYNTVKMQRYRCQNPNYPRFFDHGGRGIEFRFSSIGEAILWISENLGEKPLNYSVDRIDNDGHYEPGNLRYCTKLEQVLNRRKTKGTASKFRGVRKHGKMWAAEITINYKINYISSFKTQEEAAEAYLEKYYNYYGKFPPEYKPVPIPRKLICT